jgi:integrase
VKQPGQTRHQNMALRDRAPESDFRGYFSDTETKLDEGNTAISRHFERAFVSERQGRLTRFAANYLVERTAKVAGFENLHPHCLRHSCGYAFGANVVRRRHPQRWPPPPTTSNLVSSRAPLRTKTTRRLDLAKCRHFAAFRARPDSVCVRDGLAG